MKNLKITKGECFANGSNVEIESNITERGKMQIVNCINSTKEQKTANALLISDAFNTANKCGKLPSELLSERDELLGVLVQMANLFQSDAKYRTQEEALTSAQNLISKITGQ